MGAISDIFGYLLNWLYTFFNNYGIAIIIFSILLRIILIPITIKQQVSMKKSAKLQGELKEIQKKYKSDPEKLNRETMDLYKREKMNPFSGCLSAILQIVIIFSVFWIVSKPLTYMKKIDSEIIKNYTQELQEQGGNNSYIEIAIIEQKGAQDPQVYINMDFLGIDLSKVPTQSLNDARVYIIPVLYVISSIISIRLTTAAQNKYRKKDEIVIGQDGKPEEPEVDPMVQMNKSMTYMMPIMSVMIATVAPLGLALYWLMSNILMIIERLAIDKYMIKKEGNENA